MLPGLSLGQREGLIGYWDFNEEEDEEIAEDGSGMGNHGTLVGDIKRVESRPGFGQALEFSMPGSHLRIEHSDIFNLQEFTMALWFNPEAEQEDWGKIICKQKVPGYPFSVQFDDKNRVKIEIGLAAGGNATLPERVPNPNDWTHIGLVSDGENAVLYLNGERFSATQLGGDLLHNGEPITIGSRADSGQSFSGLIDDVRIYTRALEQEEIVLAMNSEIRMAVSPSGKLIGTWAGLK
jgi:hypothetical protein